MMEEEARRKLKAAELHAKKTKLRLWTNYVPPATNSKAISDNFTGKVGFSTFLQNITFITKFTGKVVNYPFNGLPVNEILGFIFIDSLGDEA